VVAFVLSKSVNQGGEGGELPKAGRWRTVQALRNRTLHHLAPTAGGAAVSGGIDPVYAVGVGAGRVSDQHNPIYYRRRVHLPVAYGGRLRRLVGIAAKSSWWCTDDLYAEFCITAVSRVDSGIAPALRFRPWDLRLSSATVDAFTLPLPFAGLSSRPGCSFLRGTGIKAFYSRVILLSKACRNYQ
jgi:hypothetical protein